MNNNAPTIRCIRRITPDILTPFRRVCTSRKHLSYNRADEISMDRGDDGVGTIGCVLGRGGDELEHGKHAGGRAVAHGGAAYDPVADTARR